MGIKISELDSCVPAAPDLVVVVQGGTTKNALVADFVGPAGADGADGAPGADGADGADGANGADGADGANGADGNQPVATGTAVFGTSDGTTDTTIYTVPASPSGSARFRLTRVLLRLRVAITGGGNVTYKVGTTTGGVEILVTSSAKTSGTSVGDVYGASASHQGASMVASDFYELSMAAGDTIKLRTTTAGGGISGGSVDYYVFGVFLP